MTELKKKHYVYLHQKLLDDDVIFKAYKRMRKGKTRRTEIRMIDANYETEAAMMKKMIRWTIPNSPHPELMYTPPKKRKITIRFEHGKKRKTYTPEIHEQWLHHIIMQVLEPILMRRMYKYSCGSIPKRGAHYGKKVLRKAINRKAYTKYYVKLDIRHFYNNLSPAYILDELSEEIDDEWFLFVVERCFLGFKNFVPLGFYISQWFANYVLTPIDNLIVNSKVVRTFIRYVDDMLLMGNSKRGLKFVVRRVNYALHLIGLKLKLNYCIHRFTDKNPIDFLGFLFYRNKTLMRKRTMIKASRLARVIFSKRYQNKKVYMKHIKGFLSLMGWFKYTNSYVCYLNHIKPYVNIGALKAAISNHDRKRRLDLHERMERRASCEISGRIREDKRNIFYAAA